MKKWKENVLPKLLPRIPLKNQKLLPETSLRKKKRSETIEKREKIDQNSELNKNTSNQNQGRQLPIDYKL